MNSSDKQNKGMVLTLNGEQTIEGAEELKATLLEALKATDDLTIDVAQVAAIDFSCLQLLVAAHQTALAYNKQLRLTGGESEHFKRLLEEGGFLGRDEGLQLFNTNDTKGSTK